MTPIVVFDLFGTLVPKWSSSENTDMKRGMAETLGVTHEAFGMEWAGLFESREKGYCQTIADCLHEVCRRLGHAVEPDRITRAARMRREFVWSRMQPRDDVVPTLRHLADRGCRVGLISNCGPDTPALWPDSPLSTCVEKAVFSATAGLVKPDPLIYRRLTDAMDVSPTDCLFVGDGGSRELTGATTVGMRAVLIHVEAEIAACGIDEDAAAWRGETIGAIADVPELIGLA